MNVSEAKRLRALGEENAKLKRLYADAMLDSAGLKDLLAKNGDARCQAEAAAHLKASLEVSERRACTILITVHIPLTFRKRGGRKLVVTPDGAEWAPRPRVDNAMVKALARAFRWRKMLDTACMRRSRTWPGPRVSHRPT